MGLKEKIAAILLAGTRFFGGGDAQNSEPIDKNVPTNPNEIVETYEENSDLVSDKLGELYYEENNSDIDKILSYEEAMAKYGYALQVDVSSCNGKIDWQQLNREIHPVTAIIRSHTADSSGFYEDERFEENIKACAEIGMPVGTYFVARLTQDEEEIKREANIMINKLKEMESKYNIKIHSAAVDYELPLHTSNPIDSAKSIKIISDMLIENGYKPIIYSTESCINNLNAAAETANIELTNIESWIAHYSNKNSYAFTNGTTKSVEETVKDKVDEETISVATQIGDNTSAEGFQTIGNTAIDISIINNNYIATKNNNAMLENNISNEKAIEDTIIYIVPEKDTIENICKNYNMTIDEFKKYNPQIENIDTINAKEIVNIPREKVIENVQQSLEDKKITDSEAKESINKLKGAIAFFGSSGIISYTIYRNVNKKKAREKIKRNAYSANNKYQNSIEEFIIPGINEEDDIIIENKTR